MDGLYDGLSSHRVGFSDLAGADLLRLESTHDKIPDYIFFIN